MFLKCLGLIKNNHIVLVLTSMAYNFLHFSLITNILQGAKIRGSFLNRVDIKISGKNNQVMIGEKTMMNHCTIVVIGNNCKLTIAGGSTNIVLSAYVVKVVKFRLLQNLLHMVVL